MYPFDVVISDENLWQILKTLDSETKVRNNLNISTCTCMF